MIQPGIRRAIPMGIVGFVVGAVAVLLLRAAQGLSPVWDTGVVIVMSTFTTAIFFMWGIGAFNPAYSHHSDEAEHEPVDDLDAELDHEAPPTVFGYSIWQITFWSVLVVVILAAGAVLGPALTQTQIAEGSVQQVGLVPVEMFGETVMVSQIFILIGFAAFTLLSLAVAAALIWVITYGLSRGVKTAEALAKEQAKAAPADAPALPDPAASDGTAAPARSRWLPVARFVVLFALLFVALYALFYYVLIGLIITTPPDNIILSFVNALLFSLLILRPRWLGRPLGRGARWLARQMRGTGKDGTRKLTKETRTS